MDTITTTFPTWEPYFLALAESLDTEDMDDSFREYENLAENHNDYEIITALLNAGYDPQKGFDMLLTTMTGGPRYIGELMVGGVAQKCVDAFIARGAKVNLVVLNTLFEVPDHMEEDREFGFSQIWARGIVLALLAKNGVRPQDYEANWDTVHAMDWEDIDDRVPTDIQALRYLKYSFNYYN
jgi:hypothetical protein